MASRYPDAPSPRTILERSQCFQGSIKVVSQDEQNQQFIYPRNKGFSGTGFKGYFTHMRAGFHLFMRLGSHFE